MDWKKLANDAVDKTKEAASKANEYRMKDKQERKLNLTEVKFMQKKVITIRQDVEGNYYFGKLLNEESERYQFEGYEWKGANITSHTTTEGQIKGRSGSALVGGMLAGTAGSVIGGSRGRKTKSQSVTTNKEADTKAKLVFRNLETSQIKEITILNNSETDAKIRSFFGA